ncbi:hypothetical protein DFP73DRAFT_608470 [Morchella snyderi]|nr:hypothetical protein DFP73DRAFT_608470 [Morchella snyderi]
MPDSVEGWYLMKLFLSGSQIEVMEVALQKLATGYPKYLLACQVPLDSYQPNQNYFQALIFKNSPKGGSLYLPFTPGTSLDCGLSNDGSDMERPNKKPRGASWAEWEDKALAIQVLADNPISNKVGKKENRWRSVSGNLRRLVGIDRTWSSCVDRIDRLIAQYRSETSQSKQKTGINEETNEYLENLSEIMTLFDSISTDSITKRAAKEKLAEKKEKGTILRHCSKQKRVLKKDLLSTAEDFFNSHNHKVPKHHIATQIDKMVKGLREKATDIGNEIEKKRKRDEKLHEDMRGLMHSQKSTNEMIQNWIQCTKRVGMVHENTVLE